MKIIQTTKNFIKETREKGLRKIASDAISLLAYKRDLALLLKTIDFEQFNIYREKYKDTDYGNSKHWNLRERMAINLRHAYNLNLHHSKPMKILDLGTGCAYFPYICTYYGHDVIATDLYVPMYRDIAEFLNINWKEWAAKAYEKLPDYGVKFDLVTALLLWFNNPTKQNVWGSHEWAFFLEDLAGNQLGENGSAFLVLGEKTKDGGYYDEELLNFFTKNGARVNGSRIYFESMSHFRKKV